jgi:hypothetical protein
VNANRRGQSSIFIYDGGIAAWRSVYLRWLRVHVVVFIQICSFV